MDYSHRYYPKVSTDKILWKSIDKSSISLSKKDKVIVIDFPPSVRQEYIASQELVTEIWYYDWYDKLEGSGKVKAEVIGFSVLRKPIIMFSVEGDTKNPYILIIGRQHPPEVTGVFAIKSFINELISNNELSENFLSQYNVIFIPLMNPDGVENGYWRYNENKKDLNRDWGKFSQPETIAVNQQLNKFVTNRRLILFIDFHSTYKNIFYISDTFNSSIKKEFLKYWLDDSSADLLNLGYDYLIINSKAIKNGVAKNYIHNKFKVPSVTYEVSDTENRDKIKKSSSILAKKMMENLLKLD
jgi:predicted deacylase